MGSGRPPNRFVPRAWLALALLAAFAGCRDAVGPMSDGTLAGPQAERVAASRDRGKKGHGDVADRSADSSAVIDMRFLTQDPGAPPLETYQVSFWVYRDRVS